MKACGRVPQVVEPDRWQLRPCQQRSEGAAPEVALADRAAFGVAEDVSLADAAPFLAHAFAVVEEGHHRQSREVDPPAGAGSLRLDQAGAWPPLPRGPPGGGVVL